MITTDGAGFAECCGPVGRVVVCGVSVPARLRMTFTPAAGNCVCGAGAQAVLEHVHQPADWFGVVADHWWVLPGLPLPFVSEFTPWFPSPYHVQLGTCAVGNYTLYLYPLYCWNSQTCDDLLFFGIYQHFNPPFAQDIRFKTWSAVSSWSITQGPPWQMTGTILPHQNDTICDFTGGNPATLLFEDAG